jgi:NNP family nitrate/nitrite transporter-like MFS transporter
MMAKSFFRSLVASPEVNPLNQKAKSIPILNPFDRYGRVFFFSWFGFIVAFLSWYAFPPLLSVTIKNDLHMSQDDVANSNIVALLATLLVRFISGPLCDRFGPRYVFVGLLLSGAIPTAMAGLVTNSNGLIALRFFVGILGASFVPCQVWTTGFFDKNIIGTANALVAGWGNSGGGITYFVMPAIYDSLVHSRGLTPHQAWRVSYVVPFIIISAVAIGMLLTCEDTPTGKWSERHLWAQSRFNSVQFLPGMSPDALSTTPPSPEQPMSEKKLPDSPESGTQMDSEAVQVGLGEIVVAPTIKETTRVFFSLATLALAALYACTFGTELAVNSILGAYYLFNFPQLGQTQSGRWAAMFGLLNAVFRPMGGFIADVIYRNTKSIWAKKLWLSFLVLGAGCFLLAIGVSNPKSQATMYGLIAGLAFFIAASNGANFAIVPHVHPFANGTVSGIVGASGNLGGIIFSIIFRYGGVQYHRSIWIIGVICICVSLSVSWIRPIPRGQIGGV